MWISINGTITEPNTFDWLSDSGFNYGYGAFETIRLHKGPPLFLNKHIQRLNNTLTNLHIPITYTTDEWQTHIVALATKTNQDTGVIKLYVTGGNTPITPNITPVPQHIIRLLDIPNTVCNTYTTVTVTPDIWFQQKSLNYAHHAMHCTQTQHWPIYIDQTTDTIIDSAIFSIGLIKNETIIFPTHPLQLPSISRQILIKQLNKNYGSIPVHIKPVEKKELKHATVFGSNVIRGVVPLSYEENPPTKREKDSAILTQLEQIYTSSMQQL